MAKAKFSRWPTTKNRPKLFYYVRSYVGRFHRPPNPPALGRMAVCQHHEKSHFRYALSASFRLGGASINSRIENQIWPIELCRSGRSSGTVSSSGATGSFRRV
ncbi:hypothetical protein GWI33_012065 [Rhynchophorus ferrugineus]|uniref:Uncharacterized protein n=1 Tax=Rhynchophorus ferrugineus TaxID=354439 RepID=A0A834I9G0_RHYFE|nr:hypothetical protein GWI33_012065 [Rhynchophorus ferrugineus]